jgi:hypothetical protein
VAHDTVLTLISQRSRENKKSFVFQSSSPAFSIAMTLSVNAVANGGVWRNTLKMFSSISKVASARSEKATVYAFA